MSNRTLRLCLLILFVVLSLADLLLTGYLLNKSQVIHKSNEVIYEGNPIANAWLLRFGWRGLVIFKALAMWVVGGVALYVSSYRPRLGAFVLVFACLVVSAVLFYSYSLTRSKAAALGLDPHSLFVNEVERKDDIYRAERRRVKNELISGNYTLHEAMRQLLETEQPHSPTWLAKAHERNPGCTDEECVAAEQIELTLNALQNDVPRAHRLSVDLGKQFKELYGREAPEKSVHPLFLAQHVAAAPRRPAAANPQPLTPPQLPR